MQPRDVAGATAAEEVVASFDSLGLDTRIRRA
eukprot:COSAG05_NODE_20607_length_278_cov_0.581006_1_plen_31_part_01